MLHSLRGRRRLKPLLSALLCLAFTALLVEQLRPRRRPLEGFGRDFFWSRKGGRVPLPVTIGSGGNYTRASKSHRAVDARAAAFFYPDESGVLLSSGGRRSVVSPNGQYSLTLQPDGDLVLGREVGEHTASLLWWTGTGERRPSAGRELRASTAADGRTVIQLSDTTGGDSTVLWHSDLIPSCRNHELLEDASEDSPRGVPGRLELTNSGRVTLSGLCDLYVPLSDREESRSLALIVAGVYDAKSIACSTHAKALLSHPSFSSVDVFAYILHDERDPGRTESSIEAEVQACYGDRLRALKVARLPNVDADRPPIQEGAEPGPCEDKIRGMSTQFKAVQEAAGMWSSWTVENGILPSSVLRIRPDTNFLGEEAPRFWGLDSLSGNNLVLVQGRGEPHLYCPRMTGQIGIGPSGQIAYGSPAAMAHYLRMHDLLPDTISASAPTSLRGGCEVLPSGYRPEDCARPARCSTECVLARHLEGAGVEFDVEWGWDLETLRLSE